jgi:nucleoside-diphosphate-sugar epimerase
MKVLITGAFGQIGTELTEYLKNTLGIDQVMAADIRPPKPGTSLATDPWVHLDVTDSQALESLVSEKGFTRIYHLAAILSGKGEENPQAAFHVNMQGTMNVLEAARKFKVEQVFIPSSIAVFGPGSPKTDTPNETILRPGSMYGVTKVAGELLHEYYTQHYGLDVRSLRFPGIISHKAEPGGGTTDFAVDIFRSALGGQSYRCFIAEFTRLPFMYMDDVLEAITRLMDAPEQNLTRRSYNITGFSASPGDFAQAIRQHYPEFSVEYRPDFRQKIAESWPESIDDHLARRDWGWQPKVYLPQVTREMLEHISRKDERAIEPRGELIIR